MSFEQVSIRVDPRLIKELDRIAHNKFKRRSDIIRDALVKYVEHNHLLVETKEIVTKQYLEGNISFQDYSNIVGVDLAEEMKTAKETLEESIARAKKDAKHNS